jgi:hypothetical protein
MSTSTISKVEEVNRMADIEATFEDRYAKLKLVAIKLKKKTVDQVIILFMGSCCLNHMLLGDYTISTFCP